MVSSIDHKKNKALLVGVIAKRAKREEVEEHLDELSLLADTLYLKVVHTFICKARSIHPGTFIGTGNIEEIRRLIDVHQVNIVIFDDDLSPTQNMNLENIFIKPSVITRAEVILQIFAKNARTKVAKTQVEIARLKFTAPMLKRAWTHLERQRGGVMLRGVGEKQIEIDRRILDKRIHKLEKELAHIKTERETQRKKRQNIFKVSLVGYTNAGKSTVLKALTGAPAFIQDKLFATLDSKVRILEIPKKPKILVTDTVGFIRKLPHYLIESFKSTLEEIKIADLILHIVDLSSPNFVEHLNVTNEVLRSLDCAETDMIYVFNKQDKVSDENIKNKIIKEFSPACIISGLHNQGISELKTKIFDYFSAHMGEFEIKIPYKSVGLVNAIRETATILEEKYLAKSIKLRFIASKIFYERLAKRIR